MKKEKYVAFLRGINVGGHHKVPMAELRQEMGKLNFEKVVTLLNSGNIVFDAGAGDAGTLEKKMAEHLEKVFGFPIPVILRKADRIRALLNADPFKDEALTKDIRWYVSFLREEATPDVSLPWVSSDGSFRITGKSDRTVFSVLDLSVSKTPKAMEALEKHFGKDLTTRNWNTILRLENKL